MSDLSVFLHKVAAFLQGPTVQAVPGATNAAAQVSAAATAVDGVLPGLAKAGADAALASAGPLGVAATPFVNNFIDLLIAELTARKTPAAVPLAGTSAIFPS